MVYKQEPFRAEHIEQFVIQSDQNVERHTYESWSADDWETISGQGLAVTGFRDESPIIVVGIIPMWHGRALGWALFSAGLNRSDLLFIHRAVVEKLDLFQRDPAFKRIEATVRETFIQGHRWVRLMGFRPEGLMRNYDPDGHDNRLYARIAE